MYPGIWVKQDIQQWIEIHSGYSETDFLRRIGEYIEFYNQKDELSSQVQRSMKEDLVRRFPV